MNECPVCGASVPVARQFHHKRWHHEQEQHRVSLEDQVARLQRDVRAVLKEMVRARQEARQEPEEGEG